MNYVLLKNAKCKVMFTEAYLQPIQTSTVMLFFAKTVNGL